MPDADPNPDPDPGPTASDDLVLLLPAYDDWEALRRLLPLLDSELQAAGMKARVAIVDDGSPTPAPADLFAGGEALVDVSVLALRRNLGHQRAIAVGLAWIQANAACRAVVVMDADGEDAADVVPKLVRRMDELGGGKIVFAARTRRSENAVFRVFYQLFRWFHLAATGLPVRVGNFSVIPRSALDRLVVCSDLWSHYAACVHKAKIPFELIPSHRAERLGGRSQMNFVALVTHGLCAMAVFGDRIGVRMLIATAVTFTLSLVAGVSAMITYASEPMPFWAAVALGVLLVVVLQMLLFSFVFVFIILVGRNVSDFLPIRDHAYFVSGVRRLSGLKKAAPTA